MQRGIAVCGTEYTRIELSSYLVLIMLDEPKATPETYGFATAGWNAVPTAGKIIERIAPMLGVEPQFTPEDLQKLAKLEEKEKKKKTN